MIKLSIQGWELYVICHLSVFFVKAASLSPSKPLKAPRQVRPKQLVEDQFLAEFATDLRGNQRLVPSFFHFIQVWESVSKTLLLSVKTHFFGP